MPRAVGRAPRKGRGDATVVSREAGLAEARAVTQALAVRRAVARAAADDRRAVGAREAEVACALRVQANAVARAIRRAVWRRYRAVLAAEAGLAGAAARRRADPVAGAVRGAELLHELARAAGVPAFAVARPVHARAVARAVAGARRDLDRAVVARVGRRAVAGAVDARRAPRAVARAVLVDRKLHNPLAAVVVELEPCALEPQRAGRDVPDTVILLVRVALVDPHDRADAEPSGLKHAQPSLPASATTSPRSAAAGTQRPPPPAAAVPGACRGGRSRRREDRSEGAPERGIAYVAVGERGCTCQTWPKTENMTNCFAQPVRWAPWPTSLLRPVDARRADDVMRPVRGSGTAPSARESHACVTLGANVYVFGGFDGMRVLNDLYVFDVHTSAWTQVVHSGIAPPARAGATACALGVPPHIVVASAGQTRHGASPTCSCWTRRATRGPSRRRTASRRLRGTTTPLAS